MRSRKNAIQHALEHVRELDTELVEAQDTEEL